jgi:hypothetical protein
MSPQSAFATSLNSNPPDNDQRRRDAIERLTKMKETLFGGLGDAEPARSRRRVVGDRLDKRARFFHAVSG